MKTVAAKKAPVKTERIPRYKDRDGQYLAIEERGYVYKIGWYDPAEAMFGLMLANAQIADRDADDTNLASEVCKDYFDKYSMYLPRVGSDYEFDDKRDAQACLRIINAKLHYAKKSKPIPDWAEKALAAGWSPPKGWEP